MTSASRRTGLVVGLTMWVLVTACTWNPSGTPPDGESVEDGSPRDYDTFDLLDAIESSVGLNPYEVVAWHDFFDYPLLEIATPYEFEPHAPAICEAALDYAEQRADEAEIHLYLFYGNNYLHVLDRGPTFVGVDSTCTEHKPDEIDDSKPSPDGLRQFLAEERNAYSYTLQDDTIVGGVFESLRDVELLLADDSIDALELCNHVIAYLTPYTDRGTVVIKVGDHSTSAITARGSTESGKCARP